MCSATTLNNNLAITPWTVLSAATVRTILQDCFIVCTTVFCVRQPRGQPPKTVLSATSPQWPTVASHRTASSSARLSTVAGSRTRFISAATILAFRTTVLATMPFCRTVFHLHDQPCHSTALSFICVPVLRPRSRPFCRTVFHPRINHPYSISQSCFASSLRPSELRP